MDNEKLDALVGAVAERLFVPVEASGRHVHLTWEQARTLFGHDLTPHRPLSQPGQFLARERVKVTGPAGVFDNVAVLGPARREAHVEISLTDGKMLGLRPPVKQSGDVTHSPGCTLEGPMGRVVLERGVIAARRHIHLTPEDAGQLGVTDGQTVKLQVFTDRPVIFGDTVVRIDPNFRRAAHLDYDEANACGFAPGDLGRILP